VSVSRHEADAVRTVPYEKGAGGGGNAQTATSLDVTNEIESCRQKVQNLAAVSPEKILEIESSCLPGGIAAPLLYAAADVLAGMRWEGYRFRDQTISELIVRVVSRSGTGGMPWP
jgi:hypothetical protein